MPAQLRQSVAITWARQPEPMDMLVDVEFLIVGPNRVIDVERHVLEASAEDIYVTGDLAKSMLEIFEVIALGHRLGVDQQQGTDMHQLFVGLQIQETGVKSTEPLHQAIKSLKSGAG